MDWIVTFNQNPLSSVLAASRASKTKALNVFYDETLTRWVVVGEMSAISDLTIAQSQFITYTRELADIEPAAVFYDVPNIKQIDMVNMLRELLGCVEIHTD